MTYTYRRGTLADSRATYEISRLSIEDLGRRLYSHAVRADNHADPTDPETMWAQRRPLYDYLSEQADYFCVADCDGEAVGYARSILRDGVLQLADFFVRPDHQSNGVGRMLLHHAFPADAAARQRLIIATADARAQARYLKAGVYPRSPIYEFEREPEAVTIETDLQFIPLDPTTDAHLDTLNSIDRDIIGYQRPQEHRWLRTQRQGFLYQRDGAAVGYGYSGRRTGPFALRHASDFPAVLAHAESEAARQGHDFKLEVPVINQAAVDYLLGRRFRMSPFLAFFMTDTPFGQYEQYLFTSPPFFT